MPTSDWLFGGIPNLAAQTWSVTSNAVTEDIVIPAGSYYLDDSSSALSLVSVVETALNTHSQITNTVSCYLARDRLVYIADDNPINITFTDTDARDILGFTGNLSGDDGYTAQRVSPHLWVPDRPGITAARLGRHGDEVYDTQVSSSGGSDATIVATGHDVRLHNEFDYRHVPFDYYDAGDDLGGQWRTFFTTTVRRFRHIKIYQNTLHDEASDTAVGLLNSNRVGPYRWRASGTIRYETRNEFENVHNMGRASLPVVVVPEYS
jgi:hypothetical protein